MTHLNIWGVSRCSFHDWYVASSHSSWWLFKKGLGVHIEDQGLGLCIFQVVD